MKDKNKRLYGIRGAVCAQNTQDDIQSSVFQMMSSLLAQNKLLENDIVSIQFSITRDLNVLNPAAALRKAGLCRQTALFCTQEPAIENSLAKTIRVLVSAYLEETPIHVYLGGAEVLRPDFSTKAAK